MRPARRGKDPSNCPNEKGNPIMSSIPTLTPHIPATLGNEAEEPRSRVFFHNHSSQRDQHGTRRIPVMMPDRRSAREFSMSSRAIGDREDSESCDHCLENHLTSYRSALSQSAPVLQPFAAPAPLPDLNNICGPLSKHHHDQPLQHTPLEHQSSNAHSREYTR